MVNEGKHANHRIWHILQLNIGKAAYTNADEFLKNNSFKGPPPLFIGEQIFANSAVSAAVPPAPCGKHLRQGDHQSSPEPLIQFLTPKIQST